MVLTTSKLLAYRWAVAAANFSVGIDRDQTISNVPLYLQDVDVTIGEREKMGLLKIRGKSWSGLSHQLIVPLKVKRGALHVTAKKGHSSKKAFGTTRNRWDFCGRTVIYISHAMQRIQFIN